MFQIACSNATPCSSGSEPLNLSSRGRRVQVMRNARRAIERLVVGHERRYEYACGTAISRGDLPMAMRASSASVSGVATSPTATAWSSVSSPSAHRLVERRQLAQRVACARDALRRLR